MKNNVFFTGKTLEECLKLASSNLKIDKEKINYKIIEEKRGLFNKKITISVETSEKSGENGTIKISNGKVYVKNPIGDGRPAFVRACKEARIFVDGVEIRGRKEVYENNIIQIVINENNAERRLNITISPNKMEAYISIYYIPKNIYVLEDTEETNELKINLKLKKQIFPEIFTLKEIKEQLEKNGVKFGILEERLNKLNELKNYENLLIAKGLEAEDSLQDTIDIKFNVENNKKYLEDRKGNVDFKSIGRINTVKVGDVIAVLIKGHEGKDGKDVKGGIIKHTPYKRIRLEAGEGASLKDENTVVAAIEGKPVIKGNKIFVYEVHKVNDDVDIKTGNIDFKGDVVVYGNVREGMEVKSGHDIVIYKNVEHAKIYAKDAITIYGNVINSKIKSGGDDAAKINKLRNLESLKDAISELNMTASNIQQYKLLERDVAYGEVVKILIENKFKFIIPICEEFIKSISIDTDSEEKKLANAINNNLIGYAPLKLKDGTNLNLLNEKIEDFIDYLSGTLEAPSNMEINYCQDSELVCSGDIIITGKGEYVSNVTSHGSVIFKSPGSLARGGTIKAKNEIRCGNVGSLGGVVTRLKVGDKGHIWVDRAYENTCFVVGRREYVLSVASRDIHAYLDNEGEIIVDKFIL